MSIIIITESGQPDFFPLFLDSIELCRATLTLSPFPVGAYQVLDSQPVGPLQKHASCQSWDMLEINDIQQIFVLRDKPMKWEMKQL